MVHLSVTAWNRLKSELILLARDIGSITSAKSSTITTVLVYNQDIEFDPITTDTDKKYV